MESSAKIFGTGGLPVDKIKRNERLSAIARMLADAPNRIHTLGEFCELFDAAKSTVSEDIDLVAEAFRRFDPVSYTHLLRGRARASAQAGHGRPRRREVAQRAGRGI